MSIFSVSTQKYSSVATEAKARKLQKEQSESAKFQNALANNEKTKDIAQNLQRLELTKDTQQSIYSVKFKDKNELGYQSDKAGFMDASFNKAAGLPQDFKLHKSTIKEFLNFATKQNNINSVLYSNASGKLFDNDVFENIDIADTIGQYYAIFSQVMGKSLNKDSFTDSDLANLPKGYISQGMKGIDFNADLSDRSNIDFLNSRKNEVVTNIFSSEDEMKLASNLSEDLSKLGIKTNLQKLNFANLDQENSGGFSPDVSYYKTESGYKKEALFISFLKSESPVILEGGETALKPEVLLNNAFIAAETKDHRNKSLSDVATLKKLAEDRENFKNLVLELLKNSTIKPSEDNINLAFNELNQIYALGKIK